jgi:hypothetical protein
VQVLVLRYALASVTLLLVACSFASTPPTPGPAPATPPTPSPAPVPPEASAAVDAALQAAAAQLGTSRDQLQVAQVQPQQFNDASLGCPQAGELYSQIVTPGFVVVITGGGHQLEYHADMRGHTVLCHQT